MLFTIHGKRVTVCCASVERRPILIQRSRICGIAECVQTLCVLYSVFIRGVLGRASTEMQSGVRFFMIDEVCRMQTDRG